MIGERGYEPDEFQRMCLKTWYADGRDVDWIGQLMHATLGVSGEAGEVADKVKKYLFKPDTSIGREEIKDELADLKYYLGMMAHLIGCTMAELDEHLRVKLADGHGWKGVPPIVGMRDGAAVGEE